MDESKAISRRSRALNFGLDILDDPEEEQALDKAFGDESFQSSHAVVVRNENHPPTTSKEIWGWYLYEAANQPYSRYLVCLSVIIAAFPIQLLTQFSNGIALSQCLYQWIPSNLSK